MEEKSYFLLGTNACKCAVAVARGRLEMWFLDTPRALGTGQGWTLRNRDGDEAMDRNGLEGLPNLEQKQNEGRRSLLTLKIRPEVSRDPSGRWHKTESERKTLVVSVFFS